MATLGEELKAAREGKRLTLRQIAEKTRISLSFLAALEADDYSSIPGEVFVTGFLRSYARELGIPEREVLAKYRQLNPQPAEPSYSQVKSQHKPKPSLMNIPHGLAVRKLSLPMLIILGLVLGAVLTTVAVKLVPRKTPLSAGNNTPTPTPVTPKPFTPSTAAQVLSNSTSHKPSEVKPQTNSAQETVRQDKPLLAVKLTAAEKSWYSYSTDKGQRQHGVLDKGASFSIMADGIISLDLGNAGGVKVEFNGKELKPYGDHGVPARNIVFTKDIPGEILSRKTKNGPRKIEKAR